MPSEFFKIPPKPTESTLTFFTEKGPKIYNLKAQKNLFLLIFWLKTDNISQTTDFGLLSPKVAKKRSTAAGKPPPPANILYYRRADRQILRFRHETSDITHLKIKSGAFGPPRA